MSSENKMETPELNILEKILSLEGYNMFHLPNPSEPEANIIGFSTEGVTFEVIQKNDYIDVVVRFTDSKGTFDNLTLSCAKSTITAAEKIFSSWELVFKVIKKVSGAYFPLYWQFFSSERHHTALPSVRKCLLEIFTLALTPEVHK